MPDKETDKGLIPRGDEQAVPSTNEGTNYLFVIAIDAYEHCPTLYNCLRDAHQLIELLTTRYRFEKKNVKTLFNEKATEGNIFRGFRELAQTVTLKDNVVIYFSGHGEYDKVFDEGYWIPVNAQLGAHEDFVPNSKIKTILGAIKSKHTFLIADSCFSGSLFSQFKNTTVAERLENDPSRWGLTAGRNEVVSDGKPGDNSPFAESLLYHLRKNKQALGVATLCNRVVENVIASANQTPRGEPLKVKGHRGGQFFFHPKGAVTEKSTTNPKQGNILYQIPNEMQLEKDTKCVVRIAFNETILRKELDISREATIKSIRVSNLMEVDLLDPLAAGNFEIRGLNEQEQIIDKEDFTQWLFYVKPKKEGRFPLLLKVAVIEVLYGKERKKEISLEEIISVVTKLKTVAEGTFKNAGYALSFADTAKVLTLPSQSETAQTGSGGRYEMPSPTPKPEPIPSPAPPIVPPTPTKPKKGIAKILGGIAAAILVLVIGSNIFLDFSDTSPNYIPKPAPEPSGPITVPSVDWSQRNLRPYTNPKTGKMGYKDSKTGTSVIDVQFDRANNFKENVAFVRKGNKWGLINKKGDLIVNFVLSQPGKFEDGVAVVDIGSGHLVKINPKGEVYLPNRKIKVEKYIREFRRRSN